MPANVTRLLNAVELGDPTTAEDYFVRAALGETGPDPRRSPKSDGVFE